MKTKKKEKFDERKEESSHKCIIYDRAFSDRAEFERLSNSRGRDERAIDLSIIPWTCD
jgi:hypothetical protein